MSETSSSQKRTNESSSLSSLPKKAKPASAAFAIGNVWTLQVPNFIFDVVVIMIEIAEGMFIVKRVYPKKHMLAST